MYVKIYFNDVFWLCGFIYSVVDVGNKILFVGKF